MPSLLMVLTMVTTSVTLMPTLARFSIARNFHVKQIADAAMLVLLFADAVKLQIDAVLSGSLRGLAKLNVFGEANSVGRRQDSIETDLLRVSDRFEIVRRKCRLAAGEENDDLAFRFERDGAIKNRFCVFERRLVNIADLIRIHEARIAHHVAAVGQIDSQHRAAAKLDVRRSVTDERACLRRL